MYKWGIIGTGNIARRMMKSLENSTKGEICALSSLTNASKLKEEFPNLVIYDDYDELLKDDNIDIIYISTRHGDHYKWAKKAIKANKHVLCEKPMTLSTRQTKELCQLAKKNHVFLMEALKTRFIPLVDDIKQILEEGKLGDIKRIETCFSFKAPYQEGKYLFDIEQGGILYDCGCYNIATLLDYLGNNYKITDTQICYEYDVDIHDQIEVTFENGAVGYIELGLDENRDKALVIQGSKGTLTADIFYRPTHLELEVEGQEKVIIDKPYINDDFFGELEEVHNCLDKGKLESNRLSHQDSIEIAKMMEAIREKQEPENYMLEGMTIGMCVGFFINQFGIFGKSMGIIWMPIMMSIGMSIGLAIKKKGD